MRRWLIDSLAAGGPTLVVADAVAKATILLCLTTAIAAGLRQSSAAVRHRLWGLALCGLIALPPLSWSLPGWRLPILPSVMGRTDPLASPKEEAAGSSSSPAVNNEVPVGRHANRPGPGSGTAFEHPPRSNPL